MLYSPFVRANGKIKLINEIEYSDLSVLQHIDEGYKIEYKSEWNDDVKRKKLPKSITSFANTDGGWLFVGINNDGSINPISNERTDFAQQIGEILKTYVSSPYPRFETKFVESPDDTQKGVLVIQIKEGLEPPYISNGTVYTRVGSSSEPIPIKNRQDLDNLYSKRKEAIEKWKEFCKDELYTDFQYPICSIYFYNQDDCIPYTEDIKGNEQFLIDFSKYCGYESWMYSSYDSFIFLNSNKDILTSVTPNLELFRNWNFKLNFPLCTMTESLSEKIKDKLVENNIVTNTFNGLPVDGFLSTEMILHTLGKVYEKLKEKGCDLKKYKIMIELKNIRNLYLYYPTLNNEWLNIFKNRLRISLKDNAKIEVPHSIGRSENTIVSAFSILSIGFANVFGFSISEYAKLYELAAKAKERFFPVSSYSNAEYNENLENFFNEFI